MGNGFRTVGDFIKAQAALVVTCRNCSHAAFISYHFLKHRLGVSAQVMDANFRCRLCQCVNVTLSSTPQELAVIRVDPTMHFAGIYEGKLLDHDQSE